MLTVYFNLYLRLSWIRIQMQMMDPLQVHLYVDLTAARLSVQDDR